LLASLVLFFGSELRASFMPAYLAQSGVDTKRIGTVLTAGAFAVGIVRLLISANLLRLGERAAVGLSFSMTIAGVALLPLASASGPAAMAAVSVLLAAAVGIGEPVLIYAIIKHAGAAKRSLALAGRLTANRAAMLAAPIGAGFAVQAAGPALGLPILGAMLAVISVIAGGLFWRHGSNRQNDLRKRGEGDV
jgi:sugar phosphate permease